MEIGNIHMHQRDVSKSNSRIIEYVAQQPSIAGDYDAYITGKIRDGQIYFAVSKKSCSVALYDSLQ